MLAPSEVQAIESALGELAAACDRADAAADKSSPWWSWFVPGSFGSQLDSGAASARSYADGLRATLARYTAERDRLVELPDEDHEAVLLLVSMARKAAGSTAPVESYAATVQDIPTGAIGDTAADLGSGLAGGKTTTGIGAWASIFGFFARHPFAVLAVVLLVVAGPTLAATLPALARRRS